MGEQDLGTNDCDPSVFRIIDANANRAAEGLRVVEDYLRFCCDDAHLSRICKELRHDLATLVAAIPITQRLSCRSTETDVGTTVTTSAEQQRSNPVSVAIANTRRVAEALRTLEEFGKLVAASGADFESLRYRLYTLEKAISRAAMLSARLQACTLYVLADLACGSAEFARRARALVDVQVGAIQLRDKQATDRQLIEAARVLRQVAAGTSTLIIVNDRPDIAAVVGADGVHVGQEEMSVADARSIVGPDAIVGVSTHSVEQARQAVVDGADYIGVGPVFPSSTKQFGAYPGLSFVRKVSAEVSLPAFAIGGITCESVGELLEVGATRIAVSAAVWAADSPATAAREFLLRLVRHGQDRLERVN